MTIPSRTIPVLVVITAVIFIAGLAVFAWRYAGRIALSDAGGETGSRTMAREESATGSGSDLWRALDFSRTSFNMLLGVPAVRKKTDEDASLGEAPAAAGEGVSLIAVGDVMTSRTVAARMRSRGANYPFLRVADFLHTGDIVFGNLETPITHGRTIKPLEMVFRADTSTASALREAGFTILSLANNHSMNYGAKGIVDTVAYLRKANLAFVGAGKNDEEANAPVFVEAKGMTFAFLAYNDDDVVPAGYEAAADRPGTAFMRLEKMEEAVKRAKTKSDIVIVSMHSGTEYVRSPNASQKTFARAAVDAGADLVLGHHPHVVQTLEKYRGKYIFYSLGNFIFDQMQSRDMREGLAVKITFHQTQVSHISLHPVLIEDYAQPDFLNGKEAETVMKKLGYPVEEDEVFSSSGSASCLSAFGGSRKNNPL